MPARRWIDTAACSPNGWAQANLTVWPAAQAEENPILSELGKNITELQKRIEGLPDDPGEDDVTDLEDVTRICEALQTVWVMFDNVRGNELKVPTRLISFNNSPIGLIQYIPTTEKSVYGDDNGMECMYFISSVNFWLQDLLCNYTTLPGDDVFSKQTDEDVKWGFPKLKGDPKKVSKVINYNQLRTLFHQKCKNLLNESETIKRVLLDYYPEQLAALIASLNSLDKEFELVKQLQKGIQARALVKKKSEHFARNNSPLVCFKSITTSIFHAVRVMLFLRLCEALQTFTVQGKEGGAHNLLEAAISYTTVGTKEGNVTIRSKDGDAKTIKAEDYYDYYVYSIFNNVPGGVKPPIQSFLSRAFESATKVASVKYTQLKRKDPDTFQNNYLQYRKEEISTLKGTKEPQPGQIECNALQIAEYILLYLLYYLKEIEPKGQLSAVQKKENKRQKAIDKIGVNLFGNRYTKKEGEDPLYDYFKYAAEDYYNHENDPGWQETRGKAIALCKKIWGPQWDLTKSKSKKKPRALKRNLNGEPNMVNPAKKPKRGQSGTAGRPRIFNGNAAYDPDTEEPRAQIKITEWALQEIFRADYNKEDIQITRTKGDGNCFWYSLARLVYGHTGEAMEMWYNRAQAQELKKHTAQIWTDLQTLIIIENATEFSFVKDLAETFTGRNKWTDVSVSLLIAYIFQRPVIIVEPSTKYVHIMKPDRQFNWDHIHDHHVESREAVSYFNNLNGSLAEHFAPNEPFIITFRNRNHYDVVTDLNDAIRKNVNFEQEYLQNNPNLKRILLNSDLEPDLLAGKDPRMIYAPVINFANWKTYRFKHKFVPRAMSTEENGDKHVPRAMSTEENGDKQSDSDADDVVDGLSSPSAQDITRLRLQHAIDVLKSNPDVDINTYPPNDLLSNANPKLSKEDRLEYEMNITQSVIKIFRKAKKAGRDDSYGDQMTILLGSLSNTKLFDLCKANEQSGTTSKQIVWRGLCQFIEETPSCENFIDAEDALSAVSFNCETVPGMICAVRTAYTKLDSALLG